MKTVGYFEGTDPTILTRLAARGVATLPLGNGVDGHGKYVNHLTKADGVSVVTGYLHKILPTSRQEFTPESVLHACRTHEIPVLVIVPTADHETARSVLDKVMDYVTLVDPAELYEKILEVSG
jgi:hypothetical protein